MSTQLIAVLVALVATVFGTGVITLLHYQVEVTDSLLWAGLNGLITMVTILVLILGVAMEVKIFAQVTEGLILGVLILAFGIWSIALPGIYENARYVLTIQTLLIVVMGTNVLVYYLFGIH